MRGPLRSLSFERSPRRRSTDSARSTGGAKTPVSIVGGELDDERDRRRWMKMRLFSNSQTRHASRPSQEAVAGVADSNDNIINPPIPSTRKTSPRHSSSPMSDFLSRESELLGDSFGSPPAVNGFSTVDDIDLDRAASAFPDIALDGTGDIPTPAPAAPVISADPLSFDEFPPPSRQISQDVKITGDDEIERFEDQFPDIEVDKPIPTATPQQPTFGAASPFAPRPQPSVFTSTAILQTPLADEEEPEVIKEWREKQEAEIKARDEASQARRQETISKAERSIDQFYEEYSAKKERNIKENKQEEQDFLASFSDSLSAGTTWSRICDYIELSNSQSKTLARTGTGTTDLGRFKEVLLRLKREGDAAPGAAGY